MKQRSDTEHQFHTLSANESLDVLSSNEHGLSHDEIINRQTQFGLNKLTPPVTESIWIKFLRQFNNVLIYVLIVAALLSLFMGHLTDSVVILLVVLINGLFGYIQEGKAEAALASIRSLLQIKATTLRDHQKSQIDASLLVPGDIVLMESGDSVPADIRLIESTNLAVQESALTGESFPVDKNTLEVTEQTPLAERFCMVYAGTLVTQGRGKGVVVAIGDQTEIGKIGTMLRSVEPLVTPLMQQLRILGHVVTKAILILAGLTFLFGSLWRNYAVTDLFMAAIGLAVAAIPEGLPAVITITLAIGVQRMANHKAIVRRLPAVETLGSVSVICTDKTGTLTRNEMSAQSIRLADGDYQISGVGYLPNGNITFDQQHPTDDQKNALHQLAMASALCNDARFDQSSEPWTLHGDPTEGALLIFAAKMGAEFEKLHVNMPRIAEIPFESSHGYMATLHKTPAQSPYRYQWFLKGAPETVLGICETLWTPQGIQPLDKPEWLAAIDSFATRGERVLAFATANSDTALSGNDEQQIDLTHYQFHLIGLIGIMDPPREEAKTAIHECKTAGIHIIMVTGDHATTASAIGTQLGLKPPLQVITGNELELLSEKELRIRAPDLDVVARATPEHKLRLVSALQAEDKIVAMTGDGVNDAPALKRADIGVAMGMKGTDAAKEAAGMVLADDNFATLKTAVLEGRIVYENLRKALVFLLPTNGGQALVLVAAILLGITLPITPVQILWVNMVSAVTLSLPLVFDRATGDMMTRPPRRADESLLSSPLLIRIGFVSLILMTLTLAIFDWSYSNYGDLAYARTMAINALVGAEMVYLISCRSLTLSTFSLHYWFGNQYVLIAVAILSGLQLALTYLSLFHQLFGTHPISLFDWIILLIACLFVYLLIEIEKQISRKFF